MTKARKRRKDAGSRRGWKEDKKESIWERNHLLIGCRPPSPPSKSDVAHKTPISDAQLAVCRIL